MSTHDKVGICATSGLGSSCQATNHTGDQDSNVEEGIQVAFRMHPQNQNELRHARVWKVLPKFSSVTQTTTEGQPLRDRISGRTFFTFDNTFGEDCTTKQVYDSISQGILSSVCAGLNGTIFAYGGTSSGKTYTMQGSGTIAEGTTNTGGGIVHMAAKDIFRHIQSQTYRESVVRASFVEIYNDEIRDLLASSSENRVISIRKDPRCGVFVQSTEEIVTNYECLLSVLFQGGKNRTFGSRSHTMFRVTIESREKIPTNPEYSNDDENKDISGYNGAVRVSTLNIVELAGSESALCCDFLRSLLTVSRVIRALGSSNDSKLTRQMQPSLSGNARIAIICIAKASEIYLEETRSTLVFANMAKLLKTKKLLDDHSFIRCLQSELAKARQKETELGLDQLRKSEKTTAVAVSAAREAKEHLKVLDTKISNNDNILFPASRKRRVADGSMSRSGLSPETPDSNNKRPHTTLRDSNRMSQPIEDRILPSKELDIIIQALEMTTKMAKACSHRLDQVSLILSQNEQELTQMKLSKFDCCRQQLNKELALITAESSSGSAHQKMTNNLLGEANARIKEVEAEKHQLVQALSSTIKQLHEAMARIQEVDNEKGEILHCLSKVTNSNTLLETSLQDAQEKNTILKNEIERLNQEKKVNEQNLQEASMKIEELDRNRLALSEELALNAEKLEIQQALTDRKARLEKEIKEHKEQITALSRQLESAVKENEADQKKLEDAFGRLEELNLDNVELSKQLVLMKEELSNGAEQQMAMKDELAQITEQKEKAETVLYNQELEKIKAMQSMTKLSDEVTKYKSSLELAEETLHHEQQGFKNRESLLIQQLNSCNESILVYKSTETAVKARLEATETKLAMLTEEKALLEQNLSEKLMEINCPLEATKSELCQRIAEIDVELQDHPKISHPAEEEWESIQEAEDVMQNLKVDVVVSTCPDLDAPFDVAGHSVSNSNADKSETVGNMEEEEALRDEKISRGRPKSGAHVGRRKAPPAKLRSTRSSARKHRIRKLYKPTKQNAKPINTGCMNSCWFI